MVILLWISCIVFSPFVISQISPNVCAVHTIDVHDGVAVASIRGIGIDVWDIVNRKRILTVDAPAVDGRAVKILKRRNLIAASAGGHILQLYDFKTGEAIRRFEFPLPREIRTLECTPDESAILIGLSYWNGGYLLPGESDWFSISLYAALLNDEGGKGLESAATCGGLDLELHKWLKYCNLDEVDKIQIHDVREGVQVMIAGKRQGACRVQFGKRFPGSESLAFYDYPVYRSHSIAVSRNSETVISCGFESQWYSMGLFPADTLDADRLQFFRIPDKLEDQTREEYARIDGSRLTVVVPTQSPNRFLLGDMNGKIIEWDSVTTSSLRMCSIHTGPICSIEAYGETIVVGGDRRDLYFISNSDF